MAYNVDRILATHVGSLIRPPKLIEHLKKIEEGLPYDQQSYLACLAESVGEVVQQQADAGVDLVSDGEFGKGANWAFYVHSRLGGLSERPMTEAEMSDPMLSPYTGHDREAFPEFYAEYDAAIGFRKKRHAMRVICEAPLKYIGHNDLKRDIDNLKAGIKKAKAFGGFLPVVAPASALPHVENKYYSDERAMLFGLADALREEYRTIVDAGLMVQVDDAFFPTMYDKMVPPHSLEEYLAWAEVRIDALNHALRDIPQEKTRYHFCWGSWNAPHVSDVPLKDIVNLVLKVKVGAYCFEAANPRHEHEWRVWEKVKLPAGRVLIPGVISHATNVVEHPELVAERIVRLAKLVGRDNVVGGTDCGFAQSPFTRRVHPSIMWAKLKALSEGAKLATAELWGKP